MKPSKKKLKPEQVQGLRDLVRLSQGKFAEKMLVNRVTVWRWEHGKSAPSEVHVRQMRTLWGFAFGTRAEVGK